MIVRTMDSRLRRGLFILALSMGASWAGAEEGEAAVDIRQIGGQAPQGMAEIHGVAAGEFEPLSWQKSTLHFLHDYRSPLLEPRWSGVYRNIYAPSVVREDAGYRIFYGAWDGIDSGNDNIYSIDTPDFLDFSRRRKVIDHGEFVHVCNVNVTRLPEGEYRMMCTAYPDENGQNKPIVFSSSNGEVWNGALAPYKARRADLIAMEGYDNYSGADINGMNVLFYEDGRFTLYFCDFKNFGHVFRAVGEDGKKFKFEGPVLEARAVVNDVKKLSSGGENFYLIGLHMNTDTLWYSLSRDGKAFEPVQVLGKNRGEEDRYIVAIGWAVEGNRVLGFLYGAGAAKELNRNRIFARWLQKKVVFVDETGSRHLPSCSLGPDRQFIPVPQGAGIKGHFEVYAEDGQTLLSGTIPATLMSGGVYEVREQ